MLAAAKAIGAGLAAIGLAGAGVGIGLILCTDSFTNQDVARLINILIIKYGLNCTMIGYKTGAPNIYIRYDSMDLLRTIVTPYMLPIFYYKIHLKV